MLKPGRPVEFIESLSRRLPERVVLHRDCRQCGILELEAHDVRGGSSLRALRRNARLSRTELAARACIDYADLVLLENGLLSPDSFNLDSGARLAAVLGVNQEDLFTTQDSGPPPSRVPQGLLRKQVTWYCMVSYERQQDEPEPAPASRSVRGRRRLSPLLLGLVLICIASNVPEVAYWTGISAAGRIDWYRLHYSLAVVLNAVWHGLGSFAEWTLLLQARAWEGTPVGLRPALGVVLALWFLLSLIGLYRVVEPARLARRLLPRRTEPGLRPAYSDVASEGTGG